MRLNRRDFMGASGAGVLALSAADAMAAPGQNATVIAVPDQGWRLWIDRAAKWADDKIFLPSQVDLASLPVNPPTGGWDVALASKDQLSVTLPATVEQYLWGAFGKRPYTTEEYRFADEDSVPQFGTYEGVSWWHRSLDIPAQARGKRVMLHLRGARLRAEVYLNRKLVGYSIMSELPFECDLTAAMRPGRANELAIRITNPGGRLDWRDSAQFDWGGVMLFSSHGFGGLDRGLTLSLHPLDARITDAWVLNRPEPKTVTAHAELALSAPVASAEALKQKPQVELLEADGEPQPAQVRLKALTVEGRIAKVVFEVTAADAQLWDMDTPRLYQARFRWGGDEQTVTFGFRWFSPEGIGTDAMLRLNGRRIRLYSSISWGYWGLNGMFPTPDLAQREIDSAKAIGLNCLHFHRNVGKPEVTDLSDQQGLLRVMEPGGGKHAIFVPATPGAQPTPAEAFGRAYMREKCVAMVKAFRSSPSLMHWTLQNEIGVEMTNPDIQTALKLIHDADPSRAVILNDGYVVRGNCQAMYLPYSDRYYSSDKDQWGGWWVDHQGAGDQWYDKFYKSKDEYIHMQKGKPFIVEFGEMEATAVPDHHGRMLAQIAKAPAGASYDREDHEEILKGTDAFLDKWGFRQAFPTADHLFASLGGKQFDAWQNYMENIRLGESVDIACIAGWETTAIDNHAGLVDNLRLPKGDPAVIRGSLLPVRAIAKQRKLAFAVGERAELDIWLFNDTPEAAGGTIRVSVVDPLGRKTLVQTYPAPAQTPDQFAYLLAERVMTPPLAAPGLHKIEVELDSRPEARFERAIWVVGAGAALPRPVRIGVGRVAQSFRERLARVAGVTVEDFKPGVKYDLIVSSGLKADEIARRQVGEQTGLEIRPRRGQGTIVNVGEIPPEIIDAAVAGTPFLAMVPEDGLARGAAQQLAKAGLLTFSGEVGTTRAPWMGNWNYLRAHALFDGLPVDQAAGVLHQIDSHASNGLIVDGDGIEVIAGYSRDHDRRNGAACFTVRKNGARVLFHRMPDLAGPLQDRFLNNAVRWLISA
jgi:beta-galactosidase